MDSDFFLIFLAATIEFFGVGGGEEDGTFMDAGDVFLFEMVVRCFFHHNCNSLIMIGGET